MTIRNYNDFVKYMAEAHGWRLEDAIRFYSESYHVRVLNNPTSVHIESICDDSPYTIMCEFRYPFESLWIDNFLTKFGEQADEFYHNCYDDPIELLMNFTHPHENYTLAEMEKFVSQAMANGWECPPDWTPQDFLDLYYDLEPNEEEEN